MKNPTWKQPDTPEQARRLLMAAKTVISLVENMHATIWDLYADEILTIKQHEEQQIIGMLASALIGHAWSINALASIPMIDHAWPPEKIDDLGECGDDDHNNDDDMVFRDC